MTENTWEGALDSQCPNESARRRDTGLPDPIGEVPPSPNYTSFGGNGSERTRDAATPDRAHRVHGRDVDRVLFVLPGFLRRSARSPARDVYPAWFVVVLVLEEQRFVSIWEAPPTSRSASWFDVDAPTRPGTRSGGAVPAAWRPAVRLQLKMLAQARFDIPTATTALARRGRCRPPFSSPCRCSCTPRVPFVAINQQLVEGALLAVFLFFVLFAFSAWMIRSDRAVAAVGRTVGWIAARFHIGDGSDLGARVVESRNVIRRELRDSWKRAVPAAAANQLFDFLALEASLLAVGASVDPLLVLLAYVAAATLSMIPITPGGLGFVEAGRPGAHLAGVA